MKTSIGRSITAFFPISVGLSIVLAFILLSADVFSIILGSFTYFQIASSMKKTNNLPEEALRLYHSHPQIQINISQVFEY